jgi:beclin 1
MSGQSEVDHPLCEECTDTLLDQLDHQLKITEDECKDYKDFLENLNTKPENVDDAALSH